MGVVLFYPYLRTWLLILKRAEGKVRERERNINWLPFTPTGDRTHNPGVCPGPEIEHMSHIGQGKSEGSGKGNAVGFLRGYFLEFLTVTGPVR